jgi:hypothetical protein
MAAEKKTTGPRRGVSKARLLKELRLIMSEYGLGADQPIGALDDAIQASIVDEAMAK